MLEIKAQSGARRSGAGKPEDYARAALQQDANASVGGDAVIYRVGIGEVIGVEDAATRKILPDETGQGIANLGEHLIRGFGIQPFIIVALKIAAAEASPVLFHHLSDRLARTAQDRDPAEHGPEPIFFAQMIGSRAKAFFAAQRAQTRFHQIAEEFPSGGCFIDRDFQFGGHAVGGRAGRHGTRDTQQTGAISGDQPLRVFRDDGQRISGTDEDSTTENHISIAIGIAGSSEVGRIHVLHLENQAGRIDQIRIGMVSAEILQRNTIYNGSFWRAKLFFENLYSIRSGGSVHGIEGQSETVSKKLAQGVKIKQTAHQRRVFLERVKDFNCRGAKTLHAWLADIDVRDFRPIVMIDELGKLVNAFGNLFRRRPAIGGVEFDAEVSINAPRIVAGGQDQPPGGFAGADNSRHRRRGEQTVTRYKDMAKFITDRHTQNLLNGFFVVIAAVPAHDERRSAQIAFDVLPHHVKDGLDECFHVAGLHELPGLFAQTGCTGFLVSERVQRNRRDLGCVAASGGRGHGINLQASDVRALLPRRHLPFLPYRAAADLRGSKASREWRSGAGARSRGRNRRIAHMCLRPCASERREPAREPSTLKLSPEIILLYFQMKPRCRPDPPLLPHGNPAPRFQFEKCPQPVPVLWPAASFSDPGYSFALFGYVSMQEPGPVVSLCA